MGARLRHYLDAHPQPLVAVNPLARTSLQAVTAMLLLAGTARAQQDSLVTERGDSVIVRLVDVDLRAAVQALARYVDRPVVFSGAAGSRVTLETPRPVSRRDVARLLRGMLESQGMQLVEDSASGIYRLRQRDAGQPNAPAAMPSTVAQQGIELFVIHLRHAKASEVAATVNALYGRASALGEIGQRTDPPLSRGLTQNQVPPGVAPNVVPPAPGATGQPATLSGETTIVPDARANSLLIRATPGDFALIQRAVNELDIRPLQVLIEVLIAEVRRDRSLDFGVSVTSGKRDLAHGRGAPTIEAVNTSNSLGDFVLKVMDVGRTDIHATLVAAASRGDVNILSRPVLLAANNERAVINVGSQRPFVQVARVLPTDNTARDQVVQYKDVGTKLQIIPTISADGYVMLQVAQEIDAATAEQQFDAPVISTRSVETRLLVKDGRTIVIGGLIDRQQEMVQSGIPFLSSIPWIGGLFGRLHRSKVQTELFLFLTPRVIRSDEEVDRMTQEYQDRAKLPRQ
jgi:type II secretory pathway component GspD/PulD (secretin)